MAHPKRQHSTQRSRKRRTHWNVQVPSLSLCSNCGSRIIPHRVCPFCGQYKNKQVVQIETKEKSENS